MKRAIFWYIFNTNKSLTVEKSLNHNNQSFELCSCVDSDE